MQSIDVASHQHIQALIVAPTRELSLHIAFVVHSIGTPSVNTWVLKFTPVSEVPALAREDIKLLKYGVHIVVGTPGTPGRIHDMMKKGIFKTDYFRLFVMDEADEMLSRGFKQQIQDIFKYLPGNVQIALFSATIPNEILGNGINWGLTKYFMRELKKILVKSEDLTLEGISQYYVAIEK